MRLYNTHKLLLCLLLLFILMAAEPILAAVAKAPSWQGTQWINLPPGKENLDVDDFQGRVVYLSFFQKW